MALGKRVSVDEVLALIEERVSLTAVTNYTLSIC